MALQEASKAYLAELFEETNLYTIHTKCVTILVLRSILSTCVLQSVCVHTMDFVSAHKQIK